MGFIIGFIIGGAVSVFLYYKFYHIDVINDLKAVIDELKDKVAK